jgi:hypothetical protein
MGLKSKYIKLPPICCSQCGRVLKEGVFDLFEREYNIGIVPCEACQKRIYNLGLINGYQEAVDSMDYFFKKEIEAYQKRLTELKKELKENREGY